MGRPDGSMPMNARIPGDFWPCDECAKDNILLVETDPPEDGGSTVRKIEPNGACALVPRRVVQQWLQQDADRLEQIMKRGVMCIDHELAEHLGLHKEDANA